MIEKNRLKVIVTELLRLYFFIIIFFFTVYIVKLFLGRRNFFFALPFYFRFFNVSGEIN